MMDISDQPSDKIAMDTVTDINISTSGNQHILSIIDHLTEWQEAFPIPKKKADTIVHVIYQQLSPHPCVPDSYCLTMEWNSRTN